MKIRHVTPGILPIPPKGWGAIEKLIWELHCNFLKKGHDSKIVYLDEVQGDEDVVHIHVGNLANMAHERGIPYYFTMSDHHAFLYGKNSPVYKENYKGMQNALRSFVGGKFLVDYFDGLPLYSPYGVNADYFTPAPDEPVTQHRLLCVANNGYVHNQAEDRKGFGVAIEAARRLNLPITIAGPKNNELYFTNNPPSYDKLTILYNLSEEELLETYRSHTIFLHPSQLEAGHPNLTLLESMACGVPVVGTFEANNSLEGMVIVQPTADEVTAGVETVMRNYSAYRQAARAQAVRLSWENRANEFLEIYEKDQPRIMKDKLIHKYNNITPLKKVALPTINVNCTDGMSVEILGGNPNAVYHVKFINKKTGRIEYETQIETNHWSRTTLNYYVDWKVEVQDTVNNFFYEYDLDLTGKRVLISLESKSLGDTLAWVPYAEEFRKKHNCKLICSTFLNHLFIDQYPEIEFVEPGTTVHNLMGLYRLGIFYNENNEYNINMHPSYPMDKPLQQVATDILGLDYVEIKPRMAVPTPKIDEKLITIGVHSTTQAKYWNNPTGWQEVVDHLKGKGYTVKLLSNEPDGYMGNKNPTGVIQHPPSSIEELMKELRKSKLFIGLGSGLSWLSWATNVPTLIISGFSDPISEMQDCFRIAAPVGSCHGCYNKTRLDAGDWNWCPEYKNTPRQFECTKNITSGQVIREINRILGI